MSQGNAEFAEFIAASWDPCLRAVAAGTGSMTLAEDQLAEAFARAWACWPKVRRHPAPRVWLVRTALNAGAPAWRRRSRETALVTQDVAAAVDPAVQQGLDAIRDPELARRIAGGGGKQAAGNRAGRPGAARRGAGRRGGGRMP